MINPQTKIICTCSKVFTLNEIYKHLKRHHPVDFARLHTLQLICTKSGERIKNFKKSYKCNVGQCHCLQVKVESKEKIRSNDATLHDVRSLVSEEKAMLSTPTFWDFLILD